MKLTTTSVILMDVYCFEPFLQRTFDTHSIKVTAKGFIISASFLREHAHLNLFTSYDEMVFTFELEGLVTMKVVEDCDPASLMFVERNSDSIELERGYGIFEFLNDKFSLMSDSNFRRLKQSIPSEVGEFDKDPWFESYCPGKALSREISSAYDQNFRPVIVFEDKVWVLSSLTEQHLARGWLRSTKDTSYESLRSWMETREGTFLTN